MGGLGLWETLWESRGVRNGPGEADWGDIRVMEGFNFAVSLKKNYLTGGFCSARLGSVFSAPFTA